MKQGSDEELELRFFTPGEMLLYVEHDAALTGDELRHHLIRHPVLQELQHNTPLMNALQTSQITTLALPQNYLLQAPSPSRRGLQSRRSERFSSMVTLRLTEGDDAIDDRELADLTVRLDERILAYDEGAQKRQDGLPVRSTVSRRAQGYLKEQLTLEALRDDPSRLRRVQAQIDLWRLRQKTGASDQREEPVELKGATVNWLTTSAPETIGVGGPGSIPTPRLDGTPVPGEEQFRINDTLIDDILSKLETKPCRGDGARVFILDTAHPRKTFEEIYKAYVGQGHYLLEALMTAPGTGTAQRFQFGTEFEVWRSSLLDPVDALDFQTPCEPYDPSDHGLFVAGIVRTVAPRVAITLVEVLNGRAVGTLQSVIAGFARVAEAMPREKRSVVINCSFMLATPEKDYGEQAVEGPCQPEQAKNAFDEWAQWAADNPRQLELPRMLFDLMTLLFRNQGASLVAAAGNEGINGVHPPARYPAASLSAVGVGAIQADGTSTPYSNLADSPLVDGFQAIGGMRDSRSFRAINDPAAPERGILGIFTRPFPGANPGEEITNKHGWGYWAGTSFATPIVAGLIARLRGCGRDHGASVVRLRDLPPDEGPGKAGFLKVKQGR